MHALSDTHFQEIKICSWFHITLLVDGNDNGSKKLKPLPNYRSENP
jgi:hypothetical protein